MIAVGITAPGFGGPLGAKAENIVNDWADLLTDGQLTPVRIGALSMDAAPPHAYREGGQSIFQERIRRVGRFIIFTARPDSEEHSPFDALSLRRAAVALDRSMPVLVQRPIEPNLAPGIEEIDGEMLDIVARQSRSLDTDKKPSLEVVADIKVILGLGEHHG